jgi:hypothetical protein
MLLREVPTRHPRPLLFAASVGVLSFLAAVCFAAVFLSLLGAP